MADFEVLVIDVAEGGGDPHALWEALRRERERVAPWQSAPVMVKLGTAPGRHWHAHRHRYPFLPALATSPLPANPIQVALLSNVILSAMPHVPPALSGVRVEGPWMEDLAVNPLSCEVYALIGRDAEMRSSLWLAGLLNQAGRLKFAEHFTEALQAFEE
jgi:hypothetical protein